MAVPPTPADLRQRVEAILDADSRIQTIITDDDCVLSDADLPAVIVMVRQVQNVRSNTNWRASTRTVLIGAYFVRLCEGTTAEQRTQLLAAEALLDVIPDIFSRVDRLRLGAQAMHGVSEVGEMAGGGLETRALGDEVFYAETYEFSVTVQRS